MSQQFVFDFAEGGGTQRELLGGKGAALAEMTRIGLPVPPGFTITTKACNLYLERRGMPDGLMEQVERHLSALERKLDKGFGDSERPLLLSVRSGAPVSMPGMMDTILNLGLNDATVEGLAAATGDERFALDCYRRFIQMFGDVVMGVAHHRFEEVLERQKRRQSVELDMELNPESLRRVIEGYKELVGASAGRPFPQEPREQLTMAIQAVFDSWNSDRALVYRRVNRIPAHYGTAVNVQTMVFGNMGNDSGTGVVFTRNPSTGEPSLYGEYLTNAQGEDVVAGIRTPKPIQQLADDLPETYAELVRVAGVLEAHYRDMQDLEFTVERGRLFMLQCRTGKRTARAAVRIASDMVREGLIDRKEAVLRIDPEQVVRLLHRNIDTGAELQALTHGLPASPGAASGRIVFSADEAEQRGREGEKVILVRTETTPDDIHGIIEAEGVLTSRGGMTSHAAVVARGMGKTCVCGCEALRIDAEAGTLRIGDALFRRGDLITIDGTTGAVYAGEVPLVDPELTAEFQDILSWADEYRRLGVRANADTPEDALKARRFGAEGIGLCRTEHMFMAQERLPVVQRMIMAETLSEREEALRDLLPMQRSDFEGILEAMEGLPVTIRLLDPPLHEFLPDRDELVGDVARLEATGADPQELARKRELLRKVNMLHEANPMLGQRGCRLGILFPEIYRMQVQAVFEAAANLQARGVECRPEVMIPLVGHVHELERMRALVTETAAAVSRATGREIACTVGTMIEIPRAALTADAIAAEAEFFSFGTNDLTQTTFGYSRDDAEAKFLPIYIQEKILPENPFAVLDRDGVGKLVEMGVRLGRQARPGLKTGICGEHGGDPESIAFCHAAGLDYVSCSPFRVPIARLAAAQAALREKGEG